eukprot:TRINITY_DN120857_c0_g1_i1.p1 TRINITY_DN120857_c0_g1~~TRINITY_DN120857_c0_g1_i1.p1  ORF type:complete len:371 (-),score=29.69 TRINITY_DN120857_c0_g1_i1:434-1441(-)
MAAESPDAGFRAPKRIRPNGPTPHAVPYPTNTAQSKAAMLQAKQERELRDLEAECATRTSALKLRHEKEVEDLQREKQVQAQFASNGWQPGKLEEISVVSVSGETVLHKSFGASSLVQDVTSLLRQPGKHVSILSVSAAPASRADWKSFSDFPDKPELFAFLPTRDLAVVACTCQGVRISLALRQQPVSCPRISPKAVLCKRMRLGFLDLALGRVLLAVFEDTAHNCSTCGVGFVGWQFPGEVTCYLCSPPRTLCTKCAMMCTDCGSYFCGILAACGPRREDDESFIAHASCGKDVCGRCLDVHAVCCEGCHEHLRLSGFYNGLRTRIIHALPAL